MATAQHIQEAVQQEAQDWSAVSLAQALRGMDDDAAEYTMADIAGSALNLTGWSSVRTLGLC